MRNRDYKNFSTGSIFHIYNRGNNKDNIFYDEADYKAFLFRLGLALGFEQNELEKYPLTHIPYSRIRLVAEKKLFKLHSFCLMPNHFHLLIEQCGDIPISTLMLKVCTSFAKYINKKYGRVGHIFQDQFKSVLIESNEQLMWVTSYIHMNSVDAKIVNNPKEYTWSSYIDIIEERDNLILYKDFILEIFESIENFKEQTLTLFKDKNSFQF